MANKAPIARPGGPYTALVGEAVKVNASASTDDVAIKKYRWRTSSGDQDLTTQWPQAALLFQQVGVVTLRLTVTDGTGVASKTVSTTVTVQAVPVAPPVQPPAPPPVVVPPAPIPPQPVPAIASPDGTQGPAITDDTGGNWIIDSTTPMPGGFAIRRNGVHMGGGAADEFLWHGGVVYVINSFDNWFRWEGAWVVLSPEEVAMRPFSRGRKGRSGPYVPPEQPAGILQLSDLTYLGSFWPPDEAGAASKFSRGNLTGRRVTGVSTLFMQSGDNEIIEFAIPSDLTGTPTASLVHNWENGYAGGVILDYANADLSVNPNLVLPSIYFDEPNQLLYWSYWDNYNVNGHNDPAWAACSLASGDPSSSYGPWQTLAGAHRSHQIMTRCPQAFADAYLGGKSLLIGDIGTASGNASSSWGPALFSPTTELNASLADFPTTTNVPVTPLVAFDITHKAPRHASFIPYPDDYDHNLWSQIDGYAGCGIWIKTATLDCMAFITRVGIDKVWYGREFDHIPNFYDPVEFGSTGPHATSFQLRMFVVSPAEMALAAQELIDPWAVEFTSFALPNEYFGSTWAGGEPAANSDEVARQRSITFTNGSTAITSAGAFLAGDAGRPIATAANAPPIGGAGFEYYISTVTDASNAVLGRAGGGSQLWAGSTGAADTWIRITASGYATKWWSHGIWIDPVTYKLYITQYLVGPQYLYKSKIHVFQLP